MKKPLVSIIIITYNSGEYIKKCLLSVLKVTYKPIEIIVLDNDSSDNTHPILKKYVDKLKLIFLDKNLGYAAGNNLAFQKVKGNYIFLLNPDTLVKKDFLGPLVELMEADKKIGACQPLVYLLKQKEVINLTGKESHYLGFDWIRDYQKKKVPEAGEITSFSGSGVLLRRSVLEKTKFFDPLFFMYYEDGDLSWRMRLFGFKIVFVPQSVIYHDYKYIPKESNQSIKQKLYYYERNRIISILKNYRAKTLLLFLPAMVFIEGAMVLFSLLQGWGSQKIKGYINIFKNRKAVFKERGFIQANRCLEDAEITRSFKSALEFQNFRIAPVRLIINPLLVIYWAIVRKLL